jgi:hypothetical protein
VTKNACTELESGARKGHHYHLQLVELIDAGLIERVRLGAADVAIYESSSMARPCETPDDGEATTIA